MAKIRAFLNCAFITFFKLLIMGICLIVMFGFIGAGITAMYINWMMR
jgi:hypothetical protein